MGTLSLDSLRSVNRTYNRHYGYPTNFPTEDCQNARSSSFVTRVIAMTNSSATGADQRELTIVSAGSSRDSTKCQELVMVQPKQPNTCCPMDSVKLLLTTSRSWKYS